MSGRRRGRRPQPPAALAPVIGAAACAWLALAAGIVQAEDDRQMVASLLPVKQGAGAQAGPEARAGGVPELPTPEELEALQAAIGSVAINVDDIFDERDPRENRLLYRLANDLHLTTRESTVRELLLFQPGDPYSARQTEETARLLRAREYLSDAEVRPVRYDPETNTVDLDVRVRDVWTLEPGIGFGRSGGANSGRVRLADENLFGFGQKVALEYKSNEDRSGLGLLFVDPNMFHSWWGLQAAYADNSDGRVMHLDVGQPFYSLDSRWSLGFVADSTEEVTPLYTLGEKVSEFNSEYDSFAVQGGRSYGPGDGWARRWLAGYRYDRARFEPDPGSSLPVPELPEDRLLSYPWVGIELIEDRFVTTRNRDQIGRTEDVFLGRRLLVSLGWASPALGSDRSAGIFALHGDAGRSVGEHGEMQLAAGWEGRLESGSLADALLEASSRYYHRFDERNTFLFAVAGAHADDLSRDRQLQLGGDNGLRGYPLRYQTGNTRLQATVEERYFTEWYPFRLFRVGGAVFFDVGRMWGGDEAETGAQDWLADAGIGLRIGNARSGLGNVLHVDLAFPLTGASDISSMQLLLKAQKSF